MGNTSEAIEKEYEKLYSLNEEDFNFSINIPNNINNILSDFDNAVLTLKNLLSQHKNLAQQRNNFNRAMSDIDQILSMGANIGYVAEGSIDEIKKCRETINEAKKYFST